MNEKPIRQFNVIPPIDFKYIFKNSKKNIVLFTNNLIGNSSWSLLNKSPKRVNTYDDIILLHD